MPAALAALAWAAVGVTTVLAAAAIALLAADGRYTGPVTVAMVISALASAGAAWAHLVWWRARRGGRN